MRRFAILSPVSVLLYGVVLAGIFGSQLLAAEPQRRSITNNELWQHRPANMFKMSENNDPSVCEPLLASLNEDKVIADHRVNPIIQNRFIINPWRQQEYSVRKRTGGGSWTMSWEVAYLDLDRDGVRDGLFRENATRKFYPFHVTFFVRSIDSNIVSKDSLSETEFRNIAKMENGIYLMFHHQRSNFPEKFLEILKINGNNYLLISNAFYWTLKTETRLPLIHVVKRNKTQFLLVCRFEGIVEVVRPSPF